MPHVPAWKRAEQRLAQLFGSRRRPLSGGNQGGGRDDSLHPVLYLECKHSKKHTLWTLWRKVKDRARKENRVPVVGLQEANCPGCLLVVHTDDLPALIVEWLKADPTRYLQCLPDQSRITPEQAHKLGEIVSTSLQRDGAGTAKNHPSPVVGSGVEDIVERLQVRAYELEEAWTADHPEHVKDTNLYREAAAAIEDLKTELEHERNHNAAAPSKRRPKPRRKILRP